MIDIKYEKRETALEVRRGSEDIEARVELEPFRQFYQETQRLQIDPSSLYSDLETKRELIEILHTNLKALGRSQPLVNTGGRYTGPAFRFLYEQALKKLK